MARKGVLSKILAIVGTVLVWFPLLAPVLLTAITFTPGDTFRFDYLMPAELFAFALPGGGMLLWAALRARSRRGLIGWGLGLAVVLLFGGQVVAVTTGLAGGEIPLSEGRFWRALVLGSIVAYALALLAVGIGGVLLLRDLFRRSVQAGHAARPLD